MGDTTGIGWTDKTWNPWTGCHRVSCGCDHCYMMEGKKQYGQDGEIVVRSKTTFNAPLKWKDSGRVFTCSWSDWFIAEADLWRDEAWSIIARTPHLTYQILTKRPARMKMHMPLLWRDAPWPNVWLGVSIETPEYLYRADVLRAMPATLRFLSLEPLLAPLDVNLDGIGWVIVGGESGPQRRTFDVKWLERIANTCAQAKVPLYVKQDGALKPGQQGSIPDDLWIHEFPS